MPLSSEIARMRRRTPPAPEESRKRPATTTSVVNPQLVQPVQAVGFQSRLRPERSQNFMVGGSSTVEYAGEGWLSQGGWGPRSDCRNWPLPQRVAVNNTRAISRLIIEPATYLSTDPTPPGCSSSARCPSVCRSEQRGSHKSSECWSADSRWSGRHTEGH